jgi:hypothetical protein
VLSQDRKLLEVLRRVSDAAHPPHPVGSEVDLASAFMTQHPAVVLLDSAAATSPIADLAARLYQQFPDLVVVAAGGGQDQQALANLIANGSVYRFLHKPVSEQRVKLFVEAAWRRHEEARAGSRARAALPAATARSARGAWLALTVIVALAAAAGGLVLRAKAPHATGPVEVAAGSDAELESLLARADHALDSGALIAPAGENAAELYHAALQHSARDPRAVGGLEQVIEKLLGDAEAALRAGDLDGAQRLCNAARSINPDHPRVAFLATQIGAQRERAVLARAQRAAAGGDLSGAAAMLDSAAQGAQPSMLVNEARAELARRQVAASVAELLARGRDSLERGALVEPDGDNARFYFESARELAPESRDVQQAQQQLNARLLAAGRHELGEGNLERADYWAAAAADAGADAAQVGALKDEVQRARSGPASTSAAAAAPAPRAAGGAQ